MPDYPRSLIAFQRRFPDDCACADYLLTVRCPEGLRCPGPDSSSADSLHAFIGTATAPGAVAKTDGWSAYPGAPKVKHDPNVIGAMAAHVVLAWVYRVFSNLKTWALGVYYGLRPKHLQSCLGEFAFRFNRHAAFHSLLGTAMRARLITHKLLISPDPAG